MLLSRPLEPPCWDIEHQPLVSSDRQLGLSTFSLRSDSCMILPSIPYSTTATESWMRQTVRSWREVSSARFSNYLQQASESSVSEFRSEVAAIFVCCPIH